jgi:hypothetical protein
MDEELWEMARHHAYGCLGLDPDPELAFAGVRALRELADFWEGYQVRRLREAGHSWARIAAWAGVSPQAVHKKSGYQDGQGPIDVAVVHAQVQASAGQRWHHRAGHGAERSLSRGSPGRALGGMM